MLVFLTICALINIVQSTYICDLHYCLCYNKNDQQDATGDSVKCRELILNSEIILPNVIQSLDLSSNHLDVIPSELLNSSTMKELSLSNNLIKEIGNASLMLPELKRLDLSDNLLERIDKSAFRRLKKLEYLNLANNKFTTFGNLMFHHLSNLNEIILNNNNIGDSLKQVNLFDRSGYGLTNKIQIISVSNINIDTIPDNFFVDAYDLRKLVISGNKIRTVFEIPYMLEYLDLSNNPINDISPEDFVDLPALKVLKLNNLQINEVPESAFEYLRGLKTLELERNGNLTKFSRLAFGRAALEDADDFVLEKLSIKGSRLTKLDKTLLEPFGRLIELDLQGNPWQCDCKVKWFRQLQISDYLTEHVRCNTPPQLFNAKIYDLQPKFFTCEQEKRHIGFIVAIFSGCILLAMIAVWIFLCLPKRQTRGLLLREMYVPSAAYSMLPMAPN